MAPIVTLRPAVDREALLSRFVDDIEGTRFDLTAPFSCGSLTYATDAKSICRAELANREFNGERRLPNVAECWERYWRPATPFRQLVLPRIDELTITLEYGICPLCDGRRIFLGSEYPPMGESGEPDGRTYPDYDCDTNTIADKSCALCRGRPYHGPQCVDVGGVKMQYTRLKPICALPNVVAARSDADPMCMLFMAEGFDGLAMGVSM